MGIHLRLGGDDWGIIFTWDSFSLRHRLTQIDLHNGRESMVVLVVVICSPF